MASKRKFQAVSQDDEPKHQGKLIITTTIGVTDMAVRLLVDSGATGPIINQQFVRNSQLMAKKRVRPVTVTTATGETIEGAGMYYIPLTTLKIKDHEEKMSWEVGKIQSGIDGYLSVEWLTRHNPDINWEHGKLSWRSDYCRSHCFGKRVVFEEIDSVAMEAEIDDPHTVVAVMVEWEDDKGNDIRTRLPKKYRTYAEIFSKNAINSLAQHGPYDHTIDLVLDCKPTFGPIYKFSEPELEALKAWLAKYEANGRIRKSKSPYGAPVLLVKKAVVHSEYAVTSEHSTA